MSVNKIKHIIIFFFFGHTVCVILVLWPGLELEPFALKTQSYPLDCQGSPNTFILMAMK